MPLLAAPGPDRVALPAQMLDVFTLQTEVGMRGDLVEVVKLDIAFMEERGVTVLAERVHRYYIDDVLGPKLLPVTAVSPRRRTAALPSVLDAVTTVDEFSTAGCGTGSLEGTRHLAFWMQASHRARMAAYSRLAIDFVGRRIELAAPELRVH